MPDTVAPETKLATALMGEATPSDVQPCADDLAIATAEPGTEMPSAVVESAPAPVDDAVASACRAEVLDAADAHESTSSVATTKGKKRGKKREKSVPGAPRQKRASRKKNAVKECGRATALSSQAENVASFPQK